VPHHKECWAENGGCTTFGCRETAYQSAAADRLEISFDEPSGQESAPARGGGNSKLLVAALVITLLAFAGLFLAYINLLSYRSALLPGEVLPVTPQTYDPATIAALDADYYIDFDNGTIPIGDLPIGSRVVDPSWEWEYRLGLDYSDRDLDGDPTPSGEFKPVTWIVVASDHYDGLEPHVTLLSEELIGKHAFDNSTNRGHEYAEYGYNHWGDSGTANATRGLRPWLNSTDIHAGEGFYQTFSESFKQAVLTTTVPNKEWQSGSAYSTQDRVFLPSATELGESAHNYTYRIDTVYYYFDGAGDAKRVARLDGETWSYWTRSPDSSGGLFVSHVLDTGEFSNYFYGRADTDVYVAVRPALNLKSEILVSEIRN
jgi:hypothetical protein